MDAKDFFIKYDFYGFLRNGNKNIVLVSLIMTCITYGISALFYVIYKKGYKKIG